MNSDDKSQDLFGYDGLSSDDLDKIDQEEIEKRWPELLFQVLSILKRELQKAGMDEDVALNQLEALCDGIGGAYIYFPRGDLLKAEIKAYRVWNDYNNGNVLELAKKYKLTTPRIYQILTKMRKREKAKRQHSLF
ncbi:Mor transcription activator family protein [Vibrio mediterranei]